MKGFLVKIHSLLLVLAMLVGIVTGCGPREPAAPSTQAPQPGQASGTAARYEISALSISPASVATGKPVTVQASISNSGTGAGAYIVVFKVDDKEIERKDVNLGAGEKQNISFQYTPDSPGKRNVALNTVTGTLTVLKGAEFQVSALTTGSGDLMADKPITISAEVKNSGDTEGTYSAKLLVDGKQVTSKDFTVGPGQAQRVSLQANIEAGTHKIELGGQSRSVKVLKPAQIEATAMKVTPAQVFAGQEATVQAQVTNTGDVKGTLPVPLKVNGVELDAQLVTLEPGASGSVSFKLVRDLSGKYDIGVGAKTSTFLVSDAKVYNNKTFNYSLSYPVSWAINDNKPDTVTLGKDPITAGVTVRILLASQSLNDLRQYLSDALIMNYSDISLYPAKMIQNDRILLGYLQDYSYAGSDGTKMNGSYLTLKKGRYGFEVRYEVKESEFEANKALLDAFIASFQPPLVAVSNYVDTIRGYSLSLPSGWDGLETGQQGLVMNFQNNPGHPVIRGNVIAEHVSTISAKEYAATIISQLKASAGFQLISEKAITVQGSGDGYEIVVAYTSQGNQLKMKLTSAIRGTQAISVMLLTLSSTYDDSQSQYLIRMLMESFKLIEPKPFGVSRQDSLFYLGGEIVTLDPALTESSPASFIGAIFSGLVKIGKDLKVIPDIAEKWDISPDGKTYTFYLRDGVKFHNGKPVTAADFKFSWERACDPKTESKKARTYLGDIVGALDMLDGKATELSGVKVIDDRTLQITIDGPKPYFLDKMSYVTAYVVDRANVARGKSWEKEPNGTGPFKLKQWKKDELLVLERNDNFYGDKAKLKNVVFQFFAGRSMMMYENGEIDLTGVGTNDLERVQDTANPLNKELMTGGEYNIGYLGFNVTKAPFDDPKVRQAFGMAVNMDKIIEVSMKGRSDRAAGFIPPGIPGYNADLKPVAFDPAQAKQLISASKYGGVDKLPPITMYVYGGAGPTVDAMIAMWKQNLGVEVKVEIIGELEEYYDRKHKRDFQIFVTGWHADYVDPQDFLEILFQTGSDENEFAYSNPEVDAALKAAGVERDAAARLKKYQDIEKLILKDMPAVPFYCNSKSYMLVKPYVKGLKMFPIDVNHWNEVSVIPH